MNKPIISVKEARKILGKDAVGMTDDEIANVIETLDILAKDALQMAREKLRIKKDARELAQLTYDIYKDKQKGTRLMYERLLKFLDEIDYWHKYPTRAYLKDGLKSAKTSEEKLEVLLQDTLIQQSLYPNWLKISHQISKDPVAFVRSNIPEALK